MVKPHIRVTTDGAFIEKVGNVADKLGELSPDFNKNVSAYSQSYAPAVNTIFDGEKFPGGFGITQLQTADYWTLRERSGELFRSNLYARGLVRRLVTNEINTGLSPEAAPDEEIIGVSDDSLVDWTETVENRFSIWGKNKELCDFKHRQTWGGIQRTARMEALVSGDVLVVLRQSPRSKLPTVELINGSRVQTPLNVTIKKGHEVKHGVELDSLGRVVAHWVTMGLADPKRIPAKGEKSGRRISWLLYGTDKRLDAIRGEPLLSIVMQSLKEIDRYRDSTQRKAVVNSILAMFIKKTEDKLGSLPITGGAIKKDTVVTSDTDGTPRNYNIAQQVPGVVLEELQQGEEPVGFNSAGTDEKFGTFEAAVLNGIAWAHEMPPEILQLAFSNNYSASQAAINEFKIYLNKVWSEFGEDMCQPVYEEWLISENLLGTVQAPGLLEAWRDPSQAVTFGAWVCADWYGSIKPSTDMKKQAQGSEILISNGWSSNAREARTLTGTKFSKNMKRIRRENEMKVEAERPLAEFRQEFNDIPPDDNSETQAVGALEELLDEYLDERGVGNAT